jgi:hypothetical protein
MAGTLIVSNLTTDTDNSFIVRSNTGITLFSANTTGIDVANSIGATAITNDKILSVANTKISGNIISSQITSVANTQLTGLIQAAQIGSANATLITSGTLPKTRLPTGSVLQVVSNTKTDTFTTTGSDYVDVTGLSVSITPTSASSKILVIVTFNLSGQDTSAGANYRFVRDSTPVCIGDTASNRGRASGGVPYINNVNVYTTISGSFLDSPATTSSTTYKIQITGGNPGSYAGVNRTQADSDVTNPYSSRAASTITVMEIAA